MTTRDGSHANEVRQLRDFGVRAANTTRVSQQDGVTSEPVVLCRLDTVHASEADEDAAHQTAQDILVTPEAAENLANCLHKVASAGGHHLPNQAAPSADQ